MAFVDCIARVTGRGSWSNVQSMDRFALAIGTVDASNGDDWADW